MFGWIGKILLIDLTKQSYEVIELPIEIYLKFLGGRGLAGFFLREKCHLPWNDERMPLIFMSGPINGTIAPSSGRLAVVSKSPLTSTIGDTSVGGKMSVEIKKAGWDGIIIVGKSQEYLGISVVDEKVYFTKTSDFKGLTISERIEKLPQCASYCLTGIASENGVKYSSIVFDKHYFSGRSGLGLVMNDKKLSYFTITGSNNIKIYDIDKAKEAREDIIRLINASPILKGEMGMSNYGTGVIYDLTKQRRMMPTNNFRETFFDSENLNAVHYQKQYKSKKTGCSNCTIFCKKITPDKKGLPEFETMSHFSALIGNSDSNYVFEANQLCNEYGMDTISTASSIACWLELNDRNSISGDELIELVNKIAFNKDEGQLISQGSRALAEYYGKPEIAMQVKGLELPAYDPRGSYGMALAYAVSTRGGCHLRAFPIAQEILRKPVATDRFTFSGKARIIKLNEDMNATIDSLISCKFIFFAATLEEYASVFNAITGQNLTGLDLLSIGERIVYNERIINAINGFSSKDDILPERFFKEEGSSGNGIKIPPLPKEEFLISKQNYYKIRGLDEEGLPTEEKAKQLGLEWKKC